MECIGRAAEESFPSMEELQTQLNQGAAEGRNPRYQIAQPTPPTVQTADSGFPSHFSEDMKSEPFDAAWSILKGDFLLGDEDGHLGQFAGDYSGPEYEGTPPATARPPLQRLERYNPINMHLGTKRMMTPPAIANNLEISAGQVSPRVTHVVDDVPTQQPYFRGSSAPRVIDGGIAGVNVRNVLNTEGVDNFDDFANLVGSTAAHEEVHRVIEPEIHEWATQQSGVKNHRTRQQMEESIDDMLRQQILEEDGPYGTDAYFEDELRGLGNAWNAYGMLHGMGHEKGAFALTPGMTQEDIDEYLMRYRFAPYLKDPERLVNELHLARSPTPSKSTHDERMLQVKDQKLKRENLRELLRSRLNQQQ